MPLNATVVVRYGPYKSYGLVQHRTFRLEGLQYALKQNGHMTILEEILDWNTVNIVVNGEIVYTCNIKDLDYGGDGKLDPLCQKAVIAVENAC